MPRAALRRRKLSLTSLIDVIFLLLLFFMLSSTFSQFSEVELATAGAGRTTAPDTRPVFVQLRADSLRVNAREVGLDALAGALAPLDGRRDTRPRQCRRRRHGAAADRSAAGVARDRGALGAGAGVLMTARPARSRREPTIALINIVFLMLIFFMAAATLAPPLDGGLKLVQTEDLDGRAPPDALVVHADGRLVYRGEVLSDARAYVDVLAWDARETVRIVPDAELPARDLVALGAALRAAGAARVLMVTERGLE